MGTADEQRRRRVGLAGECQSWGEEAVVVVVGGMMGQMEKALGGEGKGGDGWRGKTLLLYCVAAPEHCPVPPQHSASSPFLF